jgi:hypothetical protein
MGRRLAVALCALAALTGVLATAAVASAATPGVPWTELMPALPTAKNPQPHPIANCRKARVRCVDRELERLSAARERFGCDHRGVFATTYFELTSQLRRDIAHGIVARDYLSPRYLYREDALFANVYFRVLRADRRDDPIPAAWRIAFRAAGDGDYFGAQDMLLGINAHVQNDMPFVLAAMGLHNRKAKTRKPDHDAFNETLNRAYGKVVRAVRNRFDPSLDLTNPEQVPFDDAAGLEVVRGWREQVWRNAERLLNAETKADYRRVAASIEDYAAANAKLIAGATEPGYGATRDSYCASRLGG